MELQPNNDVEKIILDRHSVRAFTTQDVSRDTIQDILSKASFAPSGTNTQPWKVYVVQGNKKCQITAQVVASVNSVYQGQVDKKSFQAPYLYYSEQWFEPYLSRRRENGWSMYKLLGIAKGDKSAMHEQQLRNFKFFDAPVGLFFTTHKALEAGAKMAIAMLMQNIMLIAKAQGLDTCPQASWNDYHQIIMPILGASDEEVFICGMSLGYADLSSEINRLRTPREPINNFVQFFD
ncbi:nitroreductase [Acinetobacter sichuanensis]|uniref:Nitroreductase n=1 Tax=Acinetobacter sichuanensis TaxID=2136183 RepID=A0A371YM80_9GAMM|nr:MULTISPECIES: nitroreductase [Acinetobacter]MDM1768014.1 nitroreductase [Acinetobacter sp. 226-4]RFC82575.1 nitroreductase [Acinetobacter sichuanensis]